jgi:hypothetical protein
MLDSVGTSCTRSEVNRADRSAAMPRRNDGGGVLRGEYNGNNGEQRLRFLPLSSLAQLSVRRKGSVFYATMENEKYNGFPS